MKITHRIPVGVLAKSDPITPEYQAEVDRDTAKAEARYRRAEQRLERAEHRLARVRGQKATSQHKRQVAELEAIVELRRQELLSLHRQLTSSPASAMHRGTAGSHRHVPSPGVF